MILCASGFYQAWGKFRVGFKKLFASRRKTCKKTFKILDTLNDWWIEALKIPLPLKNVPILIQSKKEKRKRDFDTLLLFVRYSLDETANFPKWNIIDSTLF